MPSVEYLLEILQEIYHYLHYILIFLFFGVGIVVAAREVKERLTDYAEKVRDDEHRYRVRTTIVKDMMDEKQTQSAKLRRLRVSKPTRHLVLDPWPGLEILNNPERPANLSQFYSVPGRLGLEIDAPSRTNFRLLLSEDEEIKAHREYSTLLIYTMEEDLDDWLQPPGFVAIPPVGEECFTYEAHFPPGRRFVRTKAQDDPQRKDKPKVRVFEGPPKENKEIPYESYTRHDESLLSWKWTRFRNKFHARYHVMGGRDDFGDRLGTHDWFRVTILKPPQKKKIHICWCMEGDPTTWDWCSHTPEEHRNR